MSKVGVIQMTSSADPFENIDFIRQTTAQLVQHGAEWVVTPENAIVFGVKDQYHQAAEHIGYGPIQQALADIAKSYSVWLVVGSMPTLCNDGVATTTIIFDPTGTISGHYHKLHMFDVDVSDGHKRYRESETFTAGNEIKVLPTPFGTLGLSICYDVRFPQLYSQLRRLGAQVILVPAAFTAVTGKAHWETLLRARAIETQCWIVAVNQGGIHPCGRETWGHSMVVNPWGEIVACLEQQSGCMLVEIDLAPLAALRAAMPIEQHSRFENQFLEITSEL
jgi:deaminated glutathione amidase